MHVDTGHNFDEVISTRDRLVAEHGVRLVVASVQDDIDAGRVVDNGPSRNPLQTVTLLRGIRENKFDAAFGGARRDEEKARAKERVFSFRDEFGQWDPKAQRPELWNLYNGRHRKGEHIRVFPLSNWTEYDIWAYIGAENITLPAIYYAHRRPVFQRDGMLLAVHEFLQPERRRRGLRDVRAVPHRRRRHLHRLRGIHRRDGGRGDRRDRGVAADRTRGDPRRRPDLRGRHGRPQAGGLLLMTETTSRVAARRPAGNPVESRHRGLRRRRQVHADRRLLYDSKAVMEDQLASVERTSRERGHDYTDLALVTDGLRSEREQGITIDVAYRYFATPKRKFIIADTPGHIQYTRNMVTGTSTAQLAIVLVDARHGLLEQSRRHAFLASLLGVQHIVLAVNKMDLVDWDKARFDEIRDEFHAFAARLDVHDVTTIPMSALLGDNVVTKSANTPWYEGPALLAHLEDVYIAGDRNLVDVRFPVQYVIRPQTHDHADHRSYAGTVASGVMRPGDEVVVLPSGKTSRHHRRSTARPVLSRKRSRRWRCPSAWPTTSTSPAVTCSPASTTNPTRRRSSTPRSAGWPTRRHWSRGATTSSSTPPGPPGPGSPRWTTASTSTPCTATSRATALKLNELGRVTLRTQVPLLLDEYSRNAGHRIVHPDRPRHQRHGGGRHGPRHRARGSAAPPLPTRCAISRWCAPRTG